ncbi:MAG: DUF6545 domain-containing protein [Pseudonocardiaceae bacterium]
MTSTYCGKTPAAPPPGSTLGSEISERLYRRVIAIRDGLLALQPYRDPADTRQQAAAAGLTDRRRAAAIEAADIREVSDALARDELRPARR